MTAPDRCTDRPPSADPLHASPHDDPRRRWRDGDGVHIDVRGLPPPEPLLAIVQLVRAHAERTPVIVHHDRDPQLLYAELAELGWQAERTAADPADPGEVRLRLTAAS